VADVAQADRVDIRHAEVGAHAADFNGNGAVDSPDLKLFTTAFGLTTAGNADNDADTDAVPADTLPVNA